MTPPDRAPARTKNNLVALGTAAVLAVYSAGFERTRAAAQKFAEADAAQRRPAPPSARQGEQFIDTLPTPRPAPAEPRASKGNAVVASAKKDSAPKMKSAAKVGTTPLQPAEKPAATDTTSKSDSSSAQQERGPYKDGTYYGWGTSRHGDIQAGVEITNGRITAAWIQQCLTQYSCSWIERLPGQVETRQSAEVDFVSGATQSTNAFYYGVVQALSKAR